MVGSCVGEIVGDGMGALEGNKEGVVVGNGLVVGKPDGIEEGS
jgi:hypothetical protein